MKRKVKRFQDGGVADENFTADQIKFLGGADRTDPYILARMRSKFPDAPKETPKESFESTMGQNKNISDEIRARALKSVSDDEASSPKAEKPTPTKKPAVKKSPAKKSAAKAKSKLPMPDYSNEDMDRMGLDEFRNRRFDPAAAIGIRKSAELPKYMKDAVGFKSGGKVSSASKRADGCAVRGKTRA
jgi:hypothetical protein